MGKYITQQGFSFPTYEEIVLRKEQSFIDKFGEDIDLDPESPFGQIIAISAQDEYEMWLTLQEVWESRDPLKASGVSLDFILNERGDFRLPPLATQVIAMLYGEEGTVIPQNSKARQPDALQEDINSPVLFSLSNNLVLTKEAARDVVLSLDGDVEVDKVFALDIDGTTFTYTAIGGDTATSVISELYDLIIADTAVVPVATKTASTLRLFNNTTTFKVNNLTNMVVTTLGVGGEFTCDVTGPIFVGENTLNIIVTPVTGWDTITNYSVGLTGSDAESDEAALLRSNSARNVGKATEDAIQTALSVTEGVINASVISNRTNIVDVDGRPPKSFECIVSGGDQQVVAQTIWDYAPAGIEFVGDISVVVQDLSGNNQTVKFSRPESVYIWVKVQRALYSEETYPADGDTQIKNNILAFALGEYVLGKDVIRQRITTPIYQVPGIGDIQITIFGSTNPDDTPVYNILDIEVAANQLAVFNIDRIIVEDLV